MNTKRKNVWMVLGAFLGLVLLNVLASRMVLRIDLTDDQRFSLSDSTITFLENLEDDVLVTVYLEGDFPAGFKRLRNSTMEILEEFRSYNPSHFHYRFMDPFADKTTEEQAEMYQDLVERGLQPTDLNINTATGMQYKKVFPGALISYRERELPVSLLEPQNGRDPVVVLNQSVERLEYALATTLYRLAQFDNRKKVAISVGHGELPQALMADFLYQLSDFYQLEGLMLGEDLSLLNPSHSCLILAKPDSMFKDAEKVAIDQYIMQGGSVLWLIDQVYTSMDSLRISKRPFTVAINRELGLNDMFFHYGFRINYDLVQDAQCGAIPIVTGMVNNEPKEELLPWFYYPVVIPDGRHPLVKNTGPIRLEFASTIDTFGLEGVKTDLLLTTSTLSRNLLAPVRVGLSVATEKPTPERFNKPNLPLAVRLEGTFPSAFEGRIVPLGNRPFKASSEPGTKMIVVSDGDIAKNKFSASRREHLPLGADPAAGIFYPGNMNFLMNCVNDLTGDGWLVPLRSKQFQIRLLDKNEIRAKGNQWIWACTLLPLAFIGLLGGVWNWNRRRKFVKG